MPRTSSNNKTSTISGKNGTGSKASENKKKSSGADKKQGALNVKTSSAKEKAANFDEGRRNDANSNEM